MPSLRNSVISDILSNLSYGDFCREDFSVKFPDGSSTLVEITFSALTKYTFEIKEHTTGGNRFAVALMARQESETKKVIRTIESPGDYKNNEYHDHENISSAVDRVVPWVRNIREDLKHSKAPSVYTIDDFTAEFQSSIDEKIDDPESYFEDQEQADLIAKLGELQKRIEALESEIGLDSEKAKEIDKAIERSKSDVQIYPKGVWYKTLGTKLIKLLKEALKTKEGREIAADVIKRLMS